MFSHKIEIDGKVQEIQSIYCIGRNYVDHVQELKNEIPEKPLVFVKPKGAILMTNELKIPSNTSSLHHECEVVLSIGKSGENILESEALSYIDGITLGLDMTARDLQEIEKQKGHPWMLSKCQKSFAVIGKWQKFLKKDYNFELRVNGNVRQNSDTQKMIYNFSKIISYVSQILPLQAGDILYTGTPAGVSAVQSQDVLEAFLDNQSVLRIQIRGG